MEEYISRVDEVPGDHRSFDCVKQPAYISSNCYLNGAVPFDREEKNLVVVDYDPAVRIIERGDDVFLMCTLPWDFEAMRGEIPTTDTLNRVRIVDAEFENPDGSKLILDRDYFHEQKTETSVTGPIRALKGGENTIRVWGKRV